MTQRNDVRLLEREDRTVIFICHAIEFSLCPVLLLIRVIETSSAFEQNFAPYVLALHQPYIKKYNS